MSLGQHGHVGPLLGQGPELVDELLQLGIVDILERLLEREGHAGVVDVLRGEAEVDELLEVVESAYLVEFLLDEVFHRLHVVVGHLLDVLHALGLLLSEVAVDVAQAFEQLVVEPHQLGQGKLAQRDEVFYLHSHAVTDEGIF